MPGANDLLDVVQFDVDEVQGAVHAGRTANDGIAAAGTIDLLDVVVEDHVRAGGNDVEVFDTNDGPGTDGQDTVGYCSRH